MKGRIEREVFASYNWVVDQESERGGKFLASYNWVVVQESERGGKFLASNNKS